MLSRYLIGLTQQANHLLDVKTFMSRCVLRKTAHVLTYVFALVSGKTREKVRESERENICTFVQFDSTWKSYRMR